MTDVILILKAGETLPSVKSRRGDFESWFVAGLDRPGVRFEVVRPYAGERLPLARDFAGVVVTGSPGSVTDDDPWIPEAAGFLLGASLSGIPILGVCFGHQLVADAFGGKIMKNPRGRELGTTEVRLTDAGHADPLFEGLGPVLTIQESHSDVVALIPEGSTILAQNQMSEVQALAVNDHVHGVQFHPEFDADIVRGYVEARAADLAAERGEAGLQTLREQIRDADDGRTVLGNWMKHYVRKA